MPSKPSAGVTPIPAMLIPAVLLLAAQTATAQTATTRTATPATAAEPALVLKRVTLSTGGVGSFEYQARVTGDADLSLTVRRDRVDDVLKSIVVYDDQGGLGTISLPGREPLRELFRELPFGPEALESPLDLLKALRGAELLLTGVHQLTGRLVAVTEERVELPDHAGTVIRHRLSLMTPDGLRQAILEDLETVRPTDSRLQAQLDGALSAIARHGERDRRTLVLHTTGTGERTLRVAYVVEAPLWKAAYRLTLDSGTGGTGGTGTSLRGGLQGWAVLENLSGEDWTDVDLTVVSGRPVTFHQALYDAYYVTRPEVPVDVMGRILPGPDQGATAAPPPSPPPRALAEEQTRRFLTRGLGIGAATEEPVPPAGSAAPVPAAPNRLAELVPATTDEAATQIAFRYPAPVSVANGHSLLLPILSRPVPAEPLALYQPAVEPRHPLAVVRLTNDGASGLPPGVLTLYERGANGDVTYVGDARLTALPSGEVRLLSFAVDQKITIDRSDGQTQTVSWGRIADGILELVTTDRATTTYTITGAAHEPRKVVIEHPRQPGWELVTPAPATVEMTADAWRIAADVAAGKTVSVVAATERPRQDRFELVDLPAAQINLAVNARALPADLRQAVAKVGQLRATVADRQHQADQLEQDMADLTRDQQRLRDNLQAVGATSDLGRRYVAKLGEQEDRLDRIGQDLTTAQAATEAARQALTDYVKGLKL